MDRKPLTKEEAKQKIANYASYLADEYNLPIDSVYLYGSYAKGTPHAWSDIDICIVSDEFDTIDPLSYLSQRKRI